MKNCIVVITLCIISAHPFAQKMNSKDIRSAVKASLEKTMSIKDATWHKEGSDFEANVGELLSSTTRFAFQ